MHDGKLAERSLEAEIAALLGPYNKQVRARVFEILELEKEACPVDPNDSHSIHVDTIARQVVALLGSIRSMVTDCLQTDIARELDHTMLTRRNHEENFHPLTKDEQGIVGRYVKSQRFSPAPRLHVYGDKCSESVKSSLGIIRHNHLVHEGRRVTATEFREAAAQIIEHLVESVIKEGNLQPETTIIALAWRSSLPMGAAFAKRGFRRFVHIDAKRDEETLHTQIGHFSASEPVGPNDTIIVADPMLATGNTVANTFNGMPLQASNKLVSLSLISAPEGIFHLARKFPKLQLHTGALDTHLNAAGFICPGLGDFGDQYFADIKDEKAAALIKHWQQTGLLVDQTDITALARRMEIPLDLLAA